MAVQKPNRKGPSRRMQKQGMPAPLNESKLLAKKRKAQGEVEDLKSIKTQATNGKKRRVSHEEPQIRSKKVQQVALENGKPTKSAVTRISEAVPLKVGKNVRSVKSKVQSKKGPLLEEEDNDEDIMDDEFAGSSDSHDGIDDPDVMEDEFDTPSANRLAEEEQSLSGDDEDLGSELEGEDAMSSGSDPFASDGEDDPEALRTKSKAAIWSDDEDDSDAVETLKAANIEGLSRQLDAKAAADAAAAQAELEENALQTNIAGDSTIAAALDGDSDEEGQQSLQARLAPDLQLLRTRISDTLRALDDIAAYTAKTGKSRADFIQQLLKDICAYYGYSPHLAEKLFNLFSPHEAIDFFEANEKPRPVVIRTNTLRASRRDLAQALINRGVVLEPVGKWSKVGLQVFESAVPLGATPEYLAGHYILQAASSFLPVMALAPQEHERVLDMASAPGGKSTHIAALMRNTGALVANDSNRIRAKALIGNVHRLGVRNAIVCSYDAMEFPRVMGGFDRVLLDAPCSGTGVISKDPSVKTNKTTQDFLRLPHLQKKLLLAAIDSVDHASKTGGYVVYSTCSVTVEENEAVVAYALSRRPNVKLVETGLQIGRNGFQSYMSKRFPKDMEMCRRYYPHVYNVDGFFVAKFKKVGPTTEAMRERKGAGVDERGKVMEGVDVNDVATKGSRRKSKSSGSATEESSEGDAGVEGEFEWGDEEEDARIIEQGRRKAMRKKGLDPRAYKGKDKARMTSAKKANGGEKNDHINGKSKGKPQK